MKKVIENAVAEEKVVAEVKKPRKARTSTKKTTGKTTFGPFIISPKPAEVKAEETKKVAKKPAPKKAKQELFPTQPVKKANKKEEPMYEFFKAFANGKITRVSEDGEVKVVSIEEMLSSLDEFGFKAFIKWAGIEWVKANKKLLDIQNENIFNRMVKATA